MSEVLPSQKSDLLPGLDPGGSGRNAGSAGGGANRGLGRVCVPHTARRECLDWVIIGGLRHLERALDEYVDHYNNERPHRGLQLHPPNGPLYPVSVIGAIRCRSRLGGLLREYSRAPNVAAA
jgi:hypothetical protein